MAPPKGPPMVTSLVHTADMYPVKPGMYDDMPPDVEDVIYRGKSFAEAEKEAFRVEQNALAKNGVTLPDDHMDGYEYKPIIIKAEGEDEEEPVKVEEGPVMPMPWKSEIPGWTDGGSCDETNWKHTDVKFTVKDGLATITLNRPGANNAMNDTVSAGIFEAVAILRMRTDIRVVVFKAEGRMFCAGGDPKGFQDAAAMSDADNKKGAVEFAKFLYFFQSLPQFTIGLVQGSAMGGGVGLVSICDMAIAVKSAFFTLSEVKLGVIPATISPYVVAKIGTSNAKRLFCTAENCPAEQAKQIGLINEVVDSPDEFPALVQAICDKVSLCAPGAVSSSKKLVMNVANMAVTEELIKYTSSELARVRKTKESADGMAAVLAKQKPKWAEQSLKFA